MNPLQIRIVYGQEDSRLCTIIDHLEAIVSYKTASASMSPNEQRTLAMAYERLDHITKP